jgi:hypothetical protein
MRERIQSPPQIVQLPLDSILNIRRQAQEGVIKIAGVNLSRSSSHESSRFSDSTFTRCYLLKSAFDLFLELIRDFELIFQYVLKPVAQFLLILSRPFLDQLLYLSNAHSR